VDDILRCVSTQRGAYRIRCSNFVDASTIVNA
jgi:hypothetical protein